MRLYNFPQPIEPSRYDLALKAYMEQAVTVDGVRSIFTMGSVQAPGLSDLDVITVVDDDFSPSRARKLSTNTIDNRLFIHGPIVIPQGLTLDLQRIVHASNLVRLIGNDHLPSPNDLDEFERHALSVAYLIDFTESRLVQYAWTDLAQAIDVRSWMARLWSYTHTEALLHSIRLNLNNEDQAVMQHIRHLRANWLSREAIDQKQFLELFHQSRGLAERVFQEMLIRHYPDSHPSASLPLPINVFNKKIVLRREIDPPVYKIKTFSVGRRGFWAMRAEHNLRYAIHLSQYGFLRSVAPQDPYLSRRSKIVRSHWNWLATHCAQADSMSGYLGLKPNTHRDYKNVIRSLVSKALLTTL